ncbi:phosphatidylglycerophosphatase A [Sulfuricella sp.]|uniref:phosphatidylglycerophosphatase A family protein n=1 Tax=Sulfuricella sp. TaxID=2099377 RepID=UPI002D0A446C|nr:phosphatidylglycerophosphatase A [Sulfuricella sp.]HUX64648.1 phosphatidylglycerophosphatase A [Sulfuricella sp.]
MTISPKFVFSHPAHFLSFGFGSGLSPVAPGTAGTLVAFPLYWLMLHWLSGTAILAVILLMFAVGVWACQHTGQALGVPDYGGIVWDEIVAFLLVLCVTPPTLGWYAAAFLLFRLFDIWKPFPIRQLDERIKNGFGVMLDDLLAALYAVIVLKGALWIITH